MPACRLEDLPRRLKEGLAPLYVIHGEEMLLTLEAADAIRQAARADGVEEREVLTVEGQSFDWSQLREAAMSVSLFASRKLLEIRLPTGKPGTEGAQALLHFATHLPPDTLTLVLLPKLDRTQLASKWFEGLAAAGVVLAAHAIERAALPAWIEQRLAQQNQRLTADALTFFAERVEGNLLAARQEIDKLTLLHPQGITLTLADLQAEVANVARFDVFQLSEAWLAGDVGRTARMIEGLAAEGETPVLVAWRLADELRGLIRIRQGQREGRPLTQLMRENRVWGVRQRLVEHALPRLSLRRLAEALAAISQIDRAIKGAEAADPWHALKRVALGLCG
jgi:DNA polymerase-3 subunit delta